MAKIISRLININHFSKLVSKHLVNSQKLQHKYTNSPNFCTGILFKRFAAKDDGSRENVLSVLTYPNAEVVENIDLPYFKDSLTLKIRGHSQGIVCLSDLDLDYKGTILLCNPGTKEFRLLPWSVLLRAGLGLHLPCTRAVGFGYDSNSNDFKVVRIVMFNQWFNDYHHRVEVYNLSTDEWREIKCPVLDYIFWNSSLEICHKGVFYCLALNEKDKTRFILSFDMTEEVFHQILLPESFRDSIEYKSIGVWNETIVLFHYPWTLPEKETKIDIWAMEKDDSFSKVFTIDHVSGLVKPLLFVNSDELVMETENARVISINVNTKEVKNLPVKGEPEYPWRIHASLFKKSSESIME